MNWYLQALKKYAVFSGRARRKEYWLFALFNILITMALYILVIVGAVNNIAALAGIAGILIAIYMLAIILPALGVTVRRLHDTNRSGWWFFIQFVPIVGGIILLIFTIMDGTPGDNDYGSDPKAA
ncbi:DUF805 domain-containing protein [Halioxenophilus sp. WMMB6]|uniref:DUF805 domain-containing protein n=1 Tax=Halioxenophilus sp. WMMB6 TaxID=3073815 RepID=UPI00295F4661|nr:DUF805 domain-containing protein [Halioxenophilus sp. WMMB6]